jgi:AraC-like DNA-binding protein
MDMFAKSLNKSKSQITRIFKTAYGETPYKYLLSKRIDLAKTALTETNDPIKSIAADLCFYDEYYFSSYFKSITGHSPSEYRKLYTKKHK